MISKKSIGKLGEKTHLPLNRQASYGSQLLLALGRTAERVQRARTPEEIYHVVGNEVVKLGFQAVVYIVTADRMHFIVPYSTFDPFQLQRIEEWLGAPVKDYCVPIKPGGCYHQMVNGRHKAFYEDSVELLAELLPESSPVMAKSLLSQLGLTQAICCQITVGAHVYGLLQVLGDNLTEADVPAISVFANQIASALEKVQLALENAHLNEEVTHPIGPLEISESQFSTIYNTITNGIFVIDVEPFDQYRFISVNNQLLKTTGLAKNQIIGKLAQEVIPEDALASTLERFNEAIQCNKSVSWEDSLTFRENRILEVTVTPVYNINRNRIQLIGVVNDITERKQADLRMRRQLEYLTALRTIDMAIVGSHDLRFTMDTLLEQTMIQLGVDAADILLLNNHTKMLEFAAGRGFHSSALQHTQLAIGEGYAGRAALERNLVYIPDVMESGGELARSLISEDETFVTYFGSPLIAKGRLLGVLEIFHRSLFTPDQDWLDFLNVLTNQAAIAIYNSKLVEGIQQANKYMTQAYDATIEGWSRALDLRDKETEGHSQRVAQMTLELGRALGMSEDELVYVRHGALLHDIGKMGIPDHILHKPEPLNDQEWALMRQHPQLAHDLLSPIQYLRQALDIPYCHHEKWDGTGYPRGLRGEQIPLAARIFAVADVWDAITSARTYRAAWAKEQALEYIQSEAGKHFDPQIVDLFLKIYGKGLCQAHALEAIGGDADLGSGPDHEIG